MEKTKRETDRSKMGHRDSVAHTIFLHSILLRLCPDALILNLKVQKQNLRLPYPAPLFLQLTTRFNITPQHATMRHCERHINEGTRLLCHSNGKSQHPFFSRFFIITTLGIYDATLELPASPINDAIARIVKHPLNAPNPQMLSPIKRTTVVCCCAGNVEGAMLMSKLQLGQSERRPLQYPHLTGCKCRVQDVYWLKWSRW